MIFADILDTAVLSVVPFLSVSALAGSLFVDLFVHAQNGVAYRASIVVRRWCGRLVPWGSFAGGGPPTIFLICLISLLCLLVSLIKVVLFFLVPTIIGDQDLLLLIKLGL